MWNFNQKKKKKKKENQKKTPQPESSFKKEISEKKNFGRLSSVKTDLVMQITAMNIKPLMKGF